MKPVPLERKTTNYTKEKKKNITKGYCTDVE